MQLEFLSAANGLHLTKSFTASSSSPYPLVTNVTSHSFSVTSLEDFYDVLCSEAYFGHCLLKGALKQPLQDESRKGKSNRNAYTDLLVLDIDGLRLPNTQFASQDLTKVHVEHIANMVVSALPAELHDISYIAQASSSFGMKQGKYSLHLFFMLSVPMPPKTVKLWLQHVNHANELFSEQIELSVNGHSLKYPGDTSVADNSKLIFIAPPTFSQGAVDPFTSPDDRIVMVDKGQETFDLAQLMGGLSREAMFSVTKAKKDALREAAGMSRKREKIQIAQVGYRNEEILTNPDKVSITVADESSSPFIRCNINGGDSGAYYFNLDAPTYMWNFKDEPIFEIEKADPDFYLSIFEMFEEHVSESGKATVPVAIRDFYTDIYYCGLFDPNIQQFSDDYPLTPLSKGSIESFMLSHGRPMPDFIPDARVIFDPTQQEEAIQLQNTPYHINMYRQTDYMLQAVEPDRPLTLGQGPKIQDKCPLIYKLMHHILGNGNEEFERFVNWLAYIYQTKQKAGTAWVLTGVPGTGKGLFYSRILRPIFGEAHVPMKALQNIEEQFNLYMRTALFLIVDEFHMSSASQGTIKIADKLKNQITENTTTIRAMRSNQTEVRNFTNFIFLTNRPDAVKIEDGDRRYNIAPRQEVKLEDAHPEVIEQIDDIYKELHDFAGILKTYEVNTRLVRTCVNNDAKTEMRHVSMSVFEEFCQALKQGKLEYFSDVLQIETTNVMGGGDVLPAQRFVKGWIARANEDYTMIKDEHLRVVFHALTEQTPRLNAKEFAKRLDRNGLTKTRKRQAGADRDSNPIRGIEVEWDISDELRNELIDTYFTDKDKQLVA